MRQGVRCLGFFWTGNNYSVQSQQAQTTPRTNQNWKQIQTTGAKRRKKRVRQGARFLGFFWNENRQNEDDQNYWSIKQANNDLSKTKLKTDSGFFPQVRREDLKSLRMRCCFGQPFCCCQVIDNFFIMLIPFILPQIAEYQE